MLRTKRATITALRKVSMASSNRGLRLDLIGEGVQACGSNVVLDLCLVSKKKTRGRNVPRGVISPRGGGGVVRMSLWQDEMLQQASLSVRKSPGGFAFWQVRVWSGGHGGRCRWMR